jgi:hypothetical protein
MKHLLKKIAASKSKIIAHIKLGNDAFNLISRDNKVLGALNGCDLWSFDHSKLMSEKISNVVRDFIAQYLRSSKTASVTILKNKVSCDYESLYTDLKEIPEHKKVSIKFLPDDLSEIEKTLHSEFSFENCIGKKELMASLSSFILTVSEITTTLDVCRNDAISLTSGRLVSTMWGAKTMQTMLGSLHEEIESNDKWERIEFYSTLITKSCERLIHKLSTDLSDVCAEDEKIIGTVLIPNIIANYEQFKHAAITALISISSLIYVDVLFKKLTSYPATWFLSGGMLDDLKQDYQKLMGFLIKVPIIERDVIYPLDLLRLKNLSVIQK